MKTEQLPHDLLVKEIVPSPAERGAQCLTDYLSYAGYSPDDVMLFWRSITLRHDTVLGRAAPSEHRVRPPHADEAIIVKEGPDAFVVFEGDPQAAGGQPLRTFFIHDVGGPDQEVSSPTEEVLQGKEKLLLPVKSGDDFVKIVSLYGVGVDHYAQRFIEHGGLDARQHAEFTFVEHCFSALPDGLESSAAA